jgi:hypothetical protein
MKAGEDRAPSFRLELPIDSSWSSIDLLHRRVTSGAEAVLSDLQLCQTIAMVASELVENVVKYSDWSRPDLATVAISARATPEGDVIDVEVTNPIDGMADFEAIRVTLDWIASFPTPRDAYIARVRRLAEEDEAVHSQLGLVRVAYEGGCQIEATLLPDRILRVRATLPYGSARVRAHQTPTP